MSFSWYSPKQASSPILQQGSMERRRSARSREGNIGEVSRENDSENREPPALELRKPRHGGWKGKVPGREEQMLRGEPGYHLGR